MIHQVDPNHPTSTMLAGVNKDLVTLVKTRVPDLDILSVNTYGGLPGLRASLKSAGWEGAYIVTEWGPTGHWEGMHTSWNAPVEETSSEKAAVYKSRYETAIETNRQHCLGSYVFLWGQKQERTPTWYGLFTDRGEESQVVDIMQFLWSGKWPVNKAPHLYSLQLDGRKSIQDAFLKAGNQYEALAVAADPDHDTLSYRWEILPEPTQVSSGGDFEARPQAMQNLIISASVTGTATLKAPEKEGPYRLFVYITDGKNNVATANIPFYVQK
jgi:hypothetical protein